MQFEVGKFYKTQNGSKLRCLALDGDHSFPIICLDLEDREAYTFTLDGKYRREAGDHQFDIVSEWREPVKIEGWMNVYGGNSPHASCFYYSKEIADGLAYDRIACVFVSGIEQVQP